MRDYPGRPATSSLWTPPQAPDAEPTSTEPVLIAVVATLCELLATPAPGNGADGQPRARAASQPLPAGTQVRTAAALGRRPGISMTRAASPSLTLSTEVDAAPAAQARRLISLNWTALDICMFGLHGKITDNSENGKYEALRVTFIPRSLIIPASPSERLRHLQITT